MRAGKHQDAAALCCEELEALAAAEPEGHHRDLFEVKQNLALSLCALGEDTPRRPPAGC